MPKFKLKNAEWAVVCDGRKALILCNTGDEKYPQLKVVKEFEHEEKRTHELGRAVPTRVHESAGSVRHAIEQPDLHDREERKFLEKLLKHIDNEVREGKTKHLVLVAPPRALGMIRPVYTAAVRAAIKEEIEKDWVKLPIYEIEKRLVS